MSIFFDTAPVLWEYGLPAIPLHGKRPFLTGWTKYCTEFPDEATRNGWLTAHPGDNVGLPLGPAAGICMLDIDTDDEQVQQAILAVLPHSPWKRIGKKGMALAYRWSDIPNFKLKSNANGMICELLGLGNQLVLPPSIHPDTARPYVAGANLWEVLDQLQELPRDIEDQLRRSLQGVGVELSRGGSRTARSRARSVDVMPSRFHRWLLNRLDEAKAELAGAVKNDRNNTLIRVASVLARHVAAADEDWDFYAAELTPVAFEIGLEEAETAGTLARAWRYGTVDPTRWIRLAQEWVYLSGADRFHHLQTGEHLTQQAFRTNFGNLNPVKKISLTTFLTQNDFIEKVQNLTYDPARPSGVFEENGLKWLNAYRPSDVVAEEGDATKFTGFVEYLVPDDAERAHLLKMFAHLVQRPGEKLAHALILGSKQHGVGKSTLVQILIEILGTHNCRKATSDELESQYNAFIEGKLLVLVEEINIGAGGRKVYNRLKDQITSESTPMRRLYQDTREVRNAASFVFLTNLERPMLIEPEDRRFFVINSPAMPCEPAFYADFNAWWRSNLGVIRHYLESIDLRDFDRMAPPPMTRAKQELIASSEAPVVQELRDMLGDRSSPFHVDVVTYQQVAEAVQVRTRNATRNAIEDALREIGAVKLGQHRLPKGQSAVARISMRAERPSLWAVRNQAFWQLASGKACIEEYVSLEGRLADMPELIDGFGYLPLELHGPVRDPVNVDNDASMVALIRSCRERAHGLAPEAEGGAKAAS